MHVSDIVNEQHRLATEIETVRRFVQLGRSKAGLGRRLQGVLVTVVAAKHAEQGNRQVVERLQRERRAVVAGVHHDRDTTGDHLLEQFADSGHAVMSIRQ